MIFVFSVVGVSHYIKEQEPEDFYRNIIGKKVALRFEKENLYDPNAVKVLSPDGFMIGHVRAFDVSRGIYSILQYNNRVQYAKVLRRSNEYPKNLVAETECACQPYPLDDYEELHKAWKYSCLELQMPEEWVSLIDVTDLLLDSLDDNEASPEEVERLLGRFRALAHYGFSKDFYKSRALIGEKLKNHPNEDIRKYEHVLVEMSSAIHDNSLHNEALADTLKSLKSQISNTYNMDVLNYKLDKVIRELSDFPHDLYKSRSKTDVFATRLYYEQMPREVLIKFLSGIALAGYLGKLESKGKQKKKSTKTNGKKGGKRGRPLSAALPPFPIYNMIVGDESERNYWKPILIEMMQGKKTADAADVMFAAYEAGVIHTYSYKIVNESFGVGGRDGYEDEIRRLKKGVESKIVDTYITIFEQRKKERL